MKSIIIFSDVHEYGPQYTPVEWEFGENCFYLGDNVDIRCCSKTNIRPAIERLKFFEEVFENRFVYGNHELVNSNTKNFLKYGKILLTHGDYLFWSAETAEKYRKQDPCMNWLQRAYIRIVFNWIGKYISLPVPNYFKEKAVKVAQDTGCNTIICGHWHPKQIINIMHKDINIIIVPRGKTVLYFYEKETENKENP